MDYTVLHVCFSIQKVKERNPVYYFTKPNRNLKDGKSDLTKHSLTDACLKSQVKMDVFTHM